MFRRRPGTLPWDPVYKVDFDELGYFVNDKDQVVKKEYPDEFFQFHITSSERWNEVHREAMHECLRRTILHRLDELNIKPLYLPQITEKKPKGKQHLAILCTPLAELREKKRIVIIINRGREDLAVWSYRMLSRAPGIDGGSAVSLVKEIKERTKAATEAMGGALGESEAYEEPGIVILNTGQLLYSYRHNCSMTPNSWEAMPRKSAVHPTPAVHDELNYIPGNRTMEEHIDFCFKKIILNDSIVKSSAHKYVIGLADGADDIVKYLREHWPSDGTLPISALALTGPQPIFESTIVAYLPNSGNATVVENSPFTDFMSKRARAWALSTHPLNTPLANPTPLPLFVPQASTDSPEYSATMQIEDEVYLCPHFAGGSAEYAECVMPMAQSKILDWLEQVALAEDTGAVYSNDVLEIPAAVVEQMQNEKKKRSTEPDWESYVPPS